MNRGQRTLGILRHHLLFCTLSHVLKEAGRSLASTPRTWYHTVNERKTSECLVPCLVTSIESKVITKMSQWQLDTHEDLILYSLYGHDTR